MSMTSFPRRLLAASLKLSVAALVIGGTIIGVQTLCWRAEAAADATRAAATEPAQVIVRALVMENGFDIVERFSGRLEPARTTQLAFERGGLVTEVLVAEGEAVARGATIARLDVAMLEANQARLRAQRDQAAAALELARLTLERQNSLSGQGHVSGQRLDEARLATVAEAARLAEVDAALDVLAVDIEKSELRAPFAGIVGARRIDEGAVVSAGSPVADILESQKPVARIGVAPTIADQLVVGARMNLHVGGKAIPARVQALRPDLDGATRTVTALFALDAATGATFGEVVELRLSRRVAEPGAWVPLEALIEGRRGLWSVLFATGHGEHAQVTRESVEILHVADSRAFVRGTFRAGSQLVAGGVHRVVPGQSVSIAVAE
jgi:RND family efflux transporter MFP subunit